MMKERMMKALLGLGIVGVVGLSVGSGVLIKDVLAFGEEQLSNEMVESVDKSDADIMQEDIEEVIIKEDKEEKIESNKVSFTDVDGHWAKEHIKQMVDKGIINGYEDGTFRPNREVSIEEFAKMIVESLSEDNTFESNGSHWFEAYREEANSLGVLNDITLQRNQSQSMNRYQVAEMINPVVSDIEPINQNIENYFIDSGIFRRHSDSIYQVSSIGLINGYPDGTFGGRESVTRAEAVVILDRLLNEENRIQLDGSRNISKSSSDIKPVEIPVLMYHHFDDNPGNNSSVITQATTRNHIEYVLNQGYEFIGLNELYAYLKGEAVYMPEKPIILTVDDGYLSVYEQLYPLAQEYNVMMSLAPVGYSIGDVNHPTLPRFGWEHMREMKEDGLAEYQNHTFDLHYPDERIGREGVPVGIGSLGLTGENFNDYKARMLNDWGRLESMFEEHLGINSKFMFYPYGRFTDSTEVIAREMFIGSLSVKRGTRTYRTLEDLWAIPRYNMCENSHPSQVL